MDTTEQPGLTRPVQPSRIVPAWPAVAAESAPTFGQLSRLMAAILTFAAVVAFVARSDHPLLAPQAGLLRDFLGATIPVAAATVATLALYRPWKALLLVLALTPFWNAGYVAWQVGPIQVILQTVFVLALAAGAATTRRGGPNIGLSAPDLSVLGRINGFAAFRLAGVAVAGFIGIAAISTVASHDVALSATVLLHGIVEPIGLAAIVVFLRPSRRNLVTLAVALGVSIGVATALNVAEALPRMSSLAAIQAYRLGFARASFYNVGLFAAVIAITVPLVLAALAARRSSGLPRWATVLMVVALALGLGGLFFSLSKSAWIATGSGTILLLLFVIHSWRRRLALIVASVAISTLFIPWPALVLQVSPNLDSGYRTVMVALVGESRFDSWNPATIAGRGSLTERFYAADAAVLMALANPVLGVGLDQFGVNYLNPVYRPAQAHDYVDHAHSLFPEIGAELGLPAALLIFVIYAAALWAMWRVYRGARERLTRILAAGLLASMVSWLVVATAFGCDIYRPNRDLSSDVVVAAVVVGAALALARAVHSERPRGPQETTTGGSV